jgi:predicted type IV restriction endonuclease
MTNRDILDAAESNSLNYCMHRGVAKGAFVEGAMWALRQSRETLEKAMNSLNTECHEEM